uniref:Swi5-dependent recombination DNA repair protein 1 homolog n=2 Tax=Leptobrachium leishanense TaxID=445787 RepID=A0A8C5Q1X4_9ANUR
MSVLPLMLLVPVLHTETIPLMCNMEIHSLDSSSLCAAESYIGSPDAQNNITTKQPMSASLRERLKKTRRSVSCSCPVVKRLKIDCEESEGTESGVPNVPEKLEESQEKETSTALSGVDHDRILDGNPPNSQDRTSVDPLHQTIVKDSSNLYQERRYLLKRLGEKEDILRRLKMVKLYRSKNNLTELQSLIEKWRKGSQLVLYELQTALSAENSKISLTHLIDNCGLDDQLLMYNRTEEDFETV